MYGQDRFRAIVILPEGMPDNTEKEFATIAKKIEEQAQVPMIISDPQWISTYKLHHRCVIHFKEQRCFFVGDSAYVHNPAGGQGMNTGIQDAFNLAWKLHWVLAGSAVEKLLETYHEERFPIARKLLRTTDQVFSFVTDRKALLRWSRLYMVPPVLSALTKSAGFRSYLFKLISQIGIGYRKSTLSKQSFYAEADLQAGDRLPIATLDGCFQAYMVGGQEAQLEITDLLEDYFQARIKIYTLYKKPDLYSVLHSFGIYKDGLVLVRPDGYVAFCTDDLDLNELRDYLNRFFLTKDSNRQKQLEKKQAFPFENFIN
jgi:hypothetical protein